MIKTKRIYEVYSGSDGFRVLVDRLWPRGISKEKAHLDLWLKDIGPTTELRKWFKHDPNKWGEFKAQYLEQLKNNPALKTLEEVTRKNEIVTLLYAARDMEHNEAIIIQKLLESRLFKSHF